MHTLETLLCVCCLYRVMYGIRIAHNEDVSLQEHRVIVAKYFQKREYSRTSNMGSIMFKNQIPTRYSDKKRILVYVHSVWNFIQDRHVRSFNTTGALKHPLEGCSVQNCHFSGEWQALEHAAAVLVHVQLTSPPPAPAQRHHQRWVFMTDESPWNTLESWRLPGLVDIFNWSMTYRTDSDVPIPYGRTLPLLAPVSRNLSLSALQSLVPHWVNKRRDVLAAALISNCGVVRRMLYLRALKKLMPVHVYGACQSWHAKRKAACRRKDCKEINTYIFYLAFENSECRQYISEKVFYNAYTKGAIPVIMGATLEDCEHLLPPNSFLHVDNYSSVEGLAADMARIAASDERILSFHTWRNHFEIVNEHGYAGTSSAALCRLCEALNYNDQEHKTYDAFDIKLFLDPAWSCHKR